MKKYLFLLLLLNFSSFSQESELYRLRNEAINLNFERLQKFYSDELLKDNRSENRKIYIDGIKEKIENLYLLDENNNPISLEKFKLIDVYNKKNRKTLSKGINVWKVFTSLNGNKITIGIVDFIVSYKSKKIKFGNIGSSIFTFEYSCELSKWMWIRTP